MRMYLLASFVLALVLIAGGCSGSDESGGGDPDAGTEAAADDAPADDTTGQDDAVSDDADQGTPDDAADVPVESTEDGAGATPGFGEGTATVTLDNGESYSFTILCTLEPQEAAGSEILFTLTSSDDPVNLDVTQFGADDFGGAGMITLYDSTTFDLLWQASGLTYGAELALDGSTVTGTGSFLQGDGSSGETAAGELIANC